MKRIQLNKVEKDNYGSITSVINTAKWFDVEAAEVYKEATYWDGQNKRSVNCEKHNYQELYETKSGNWVICNFNDFSGSRTTYESIGEGEAKEWLIKNGYKLADEPELVAKYEI